MPRVRRMVRIDEDNCDGCGLCIPACAEGALRIANGKARLVGDIYCNGLGTCLSECPQAALALEEREAADFEPAAAARHHQQGAWSAGPQPWAPARQGGMTGGGDMSGDAYRRGSSNLSNWPIQLRLVPITAPYFSGADLVVAADCVPFVFPDFSREFVNHRTVVVGCPKLDDAELYRRKLAQILLENDVRSVHAVRVDVPCCVGLPQIVSQAAQAAGKAIPATGTTISTDGEVLGSEYLGADRE